MELTPLGVSIQGAQQLVSGEIITSLGDRLKLAKILGQRDQSAGQRADLRGTAVDPSDPSGNTIYVGGASGGIWRDKPSLLGTQQFFAGLPVTDALDRQRLAQTFADIFAPGASRTRLPWTPY